MKDFIFEYAFLLDFKWSEESIVVLPWCLFIFYIFSVNTFSYCKSSAKISNKNSIDWKSHVDCTKERWFFSFFNHFFWCEEILAEKPSKSGNIYRKRLFHWIDLNYLIKTRKELLLKPWKFHHISRAYCYNIIYYIITNNL